MKTLEYEHSQASNSGANAALLLDAESHLSIRTVLMLDDGTPLRILTRSRHFSTESIRCLVNGISGKGSIWFRLSLIQRIA